MVKKRESAQLRAWAESLRRSAEATRNEALARGAAWGLYAVSLESAAAQTAKAQRLEEEAAQLESESGLIAAAARAGARLGA